MSATLKGNVPSSAGQIWSDAKKMVALRRQLLEYEVKSDLATAKRFGVLAAAGCVLGLLGAFIFLVLLAGLLDGWIDRSQVPWATVSLGGVALLGGGAMLLSARSGFRSRLLAFRDSRAEIQEDLVWMREWIDGQLNGNVPESRE